MKVSNEYLIPFAGLKLGKHQFKFQINNKFFEAFEFDEYISSNIEATVVFEKKNTLLELKFSHNGTVNLLCDLTSEEFSLPIKGKINLVVQFGDEFNNDNEELLIIPHGEHQLDVSQYIYEMIVLSVPLKRVHPGVLDGSLKSEVLEKLQKLSIKEEEEENKIEPIWDKLKQLLTDK